MTDFLDGEVGEFDWGPATRRPFAPRPRNTGHIGDHLALIHALMIALGTIALTIGLATAWLSYSP